MLIFVFYKFQLEGHQESHNEIGSLNLADRLVRFDMRTFHNSVTTPQPTTPLSQSLCIFEGRRGWTIFQEIGKNGGWGLPQSQLGVDGGVRVLFPWKGVTSLQLHISFMALLYTSFSLF